MAKVKLRSALTRVRGRMGQVVFRRYHDEVIMSPRPAVSWIDGP